MTKKDLNCFKMPEGCTEFLVVCPGTWGKGNTMAEALKNAQQPASAVIGILAGTKVHVDEMGMAYGKVTIWKKEGS